MNTPPPGFADLIGDAEAAEPSTPVWRTLDVDDVGELTATRPRPWALPLVAAAVSDEFATVLWPEREPYHRRNDAIARMVGSHITEADFRRLLVAQMAGEVPEDVFDKVAEAVCRWGTARPWPAVATLVVHTAHHWRDVRAKLALAGIPDPLTLPSMHTLLDIVETIAVESMANARDGKTKVERFYHALYRPRVVKGRRLVPPSGFSDADTEASFDAFSKGLST